VLQALEEHVLTPKAVEHAVLFSERDENAEQRKELDGRLKDILRRIANINNAIADGAAPVSLLAKLRELEENQHDVEETLAGLKPVPRLAPEVVAGRLDEWRRMLRGSPTQARAVIQRIIAGRITFTPDGGGYVFSATTRFSKLFSGVAVPKPEWLWDGDVRGLEHLTPEDTFDGDYGRLLERAEKRVLGMASPTGFEPVFWP
jgi:hypothetical protein